MDDAGKDVLMIAMEVDGKPHDAPLEPAEGPGKPLALVADDDRTIRLFLSRVLANCGVEVLEADNGKEALELFELHRGALSLVVLDVIMPVLGGEQVLAEIRASDTTTQVLMVSGEVEREQREQLLASGATAFLSKPLDTMSLTATIRRLLPEQDARP